MLVVIRILRRAVDRRGDETGAALVAIIIVMFFGFAVVTAVTASVMFTVQSNVGNRSSTQAYIAAESGPASSESTPPPKAPSFPTTTPSRPRSNRAGVQKRCSTRRAHVS